eukprot:COSAG01_NODE_2402_length_7759_cov_9.960313_10_plen_109_part_00
MNASAFIYFFIYGVSDCVSVDSISLIFANSVCTSPSFANSVCISPSLASSLASSFASTPFNFASISTISLLVCCFWRCFTRPVMPSHGGSEICRAPAGVKICKYCPYV